ncbi:MAG: type II toxin-antitoxin system MqsA family antitoxin [Planctomycetes bacterium]|nr:type II toxin-antitoxin system MqsA family antitoxin [Planctomycetota bacterium]
MNKPEEPPDLCPVCGGRMGPGETVFAVELGFGVAVVRHVPAIVCETCGENWFEDPTAAKLEEIVARARREQSQVEVVAYPE